ncbi:MAG: DUF455 family protein [Verrucomicrobiales bacterium]|nr:DUF455 family protein [Verrucomicrobiales bacterium]
MMRVDEFAHRVLLAESLQEKLEFVDLGDLSDHERDSAIGKNVEPGRPVHLKMQRKGGAHTLASPNISEVSDDEDRGRLLHFFANHELLATELMALVLLKFPDAPSEFRRGVLRTLKEEQRHTKWYIQRMKECGVEFGDFPVSRYFWDMVATMETPLDYVARLSLTFEQANLDYSLHYAEVMRQAGDDASAAILQQIYKDEIRHVSYGLKWFRVWKEADEDDWTAFKRSLSFPLSPRRAKGAGSKINREGRLAAGLDEDFINELEVFERSVGRTPNVFYFCPDAEDEMSEQWQGKGYQPSKIMESLVRDLEVLMLFLSRRDDVVLLRQAPSREYLMRLRDAGFDLPEIEVLNNKGRIDDDSFLRERKINALRPWAWCPSSGQVMQPLQEKCSAAEKSLEARWNPKLRGLFSKMMGAELADEVGDVQIATNCRSMDEVESQVAALAGQGVAQAVIKASFAASGRGLILIDCQQAFDGAVARRVQRVLAKQGEVLVEPWLQRVLDFSVQYEMESSGLRKVGLIRLQNDDRGQFKSCVFASKFCQGMKPELARFMMEVSLPVYAEGGALSRGLQEVLQQCGYRGPVGVDAFVYRDEAGRLCLRQVCEVNPRYTMGRLTLELGKRVAPGHSLKFEILRKKDLAPDEGLQVDRRGLFCRGRMCLNDRDRAENFLACLSVGKRLDDIEDETCLGTR